MKKVTLVRSSSFHYGVGTYLFFKDCIYLFLEKGREGGREGEKHHVWLPLVRPLLGIWPTTQACALTGNRTSDLSVCRVMPKPLSHTTGQQEHI